MKPPPIREVTTVEVFVEDDDDDDDESQPHLNPVVITSQFQEQRQLT